MRLIRLAHHNHHYHLQHLWLYVGIQWWLMGPEPKIRTRHIRRGWQDAPVSVNVSMVRAVALPLVACAIVGAYPTTCATRLFSTMRMTNLDAMIRRSFIDEHEHH